MSLFNKNNYSEVNIGDGIIVYNFKIDSARDINDVILLFEKFLSRKGYKKIEINGVKSYLKIPKNKEILKGWKPHCIILGKEINYKKEDIRKNRTCPFFIKRNNFVFNSLNISNDENFYNQVNLISWVYEFQMNKNIIINSQINFPNDIANKVIMLGKIKNKDVKKEFKSILNYMGNSINNNML